MRPAPNLRHLFTIARLLLAALLAAVVGITAGLSLAEFMA